MILLSGRTPLLQDFFHTRFLICEECITAWRRLGSIGTAQTANW